MKKIRCGEGLSEELQDEITNEQIEDSNNKKEEKIVWVSQY